MYLKHVAHSTLHRQAHASLIRDNVQHTQATPGIRFGCCHSEASASQLPAPALAAAIPKHPRLSRPRSAGLSARRRRSVSAPTARLVPGCAGRSRPPTRLGETKTTRKAHAQKENLPLCPAAAKRKRLAKHGPKKKISPSARRRRNENDSQSTRPKRKSLPVPGGDETKTTRKAHAQKKISPCARRRRNENDTQSEHLVLAKRTFFPCLFFAFRRGETHFVCQKRVSPR